MSTELHADPLQQKASTVCAKHGNIEGKVNFSGPGTRRTFGIAVGQVHFTLPKQQCQSNEGTKDVDTIRKKFIGDKLLALAANHCGYSIRTCLTDDCHYTRRRRFWHATL